MNRAKTSNGKRIAHSSMLSTVDELFLLRLSAPLKHLSSKKKPTNDLKNKSLSSIRKCIKASNKPKISSKKVTPYIPKQNVQNISVQNPFFRWSTSSSFNSIANSSFQPMHWANAEVVHFTGLKMVIRRLN